MKTLQALNDQLHVHLQEDMFDIDLNIEKQIPFIVAERVSKGLLDEHDKNICLNFLIDAVKIQTDKVYKIIRS